jgi:hypothetical protein
VSSRRVPAGASPTMFLYNTVTAVDNRMNITTQLPQVDPAIRNMVILQELLYSVTDRTWYNNKCIKG